MARVLPEFLKPTAGDDAADARWFSLTKLPELAFDHDRILVRVRNRLADREV